MKNTLTSCGLDFYPARHNFSHLNSEPLSLRRSTLVVLALAAALFPRVLAAIGAPAFINFVHFAFVLFFFLLSLNLAQPFNRKIISGLLALLGVIALSAVFNGFAVANVVLDFLLLAEPFLLLSIIVAGRWTKDGIKRFRFFLLAFVMTHVVFAFFQHLVLNLTDDDVKGIFLNQGAGHHVGGGISLTAAVYLAIVPWCRSRFVRFALALACFMVVIFSDSKQVLLAFIVSMGMMILLRAGNIKRLLTYFSAAAVSIAATYILAITVFPALGVWMNIYLIEMGLEAKLSVFPHITAFYDSPLDWLFGLGPGGSVGRLAWLIPDYYKYLQAVGVTVSPVTRAVFAAQEANWISNSRTGSSIWSLTFSWAGVWGDLGLFGLAAYLNLWRLVWHYICQTDVAKYLLLTVFVLGFIFAWMEEPGFMLVVIGFVGLQWQEFRLAQQEESNLPAKVGEYAQTAKIFKRSGKTLSRPNYSKRRPDFGFETN